MVVGTFQFGEVNVICAYGHDHSQRCDGTVPRLHPVVL